MGVLLLCNEGGEVKQENESEERKVVKASALKLVVVILKPTNHIPCTQTTFPTSFSPSLALFILLFLRIMLFAYPIFKKPHEILYSKASGHEADCIVASLLRRLAILTLMLCVFAWKA